MIFEGPEVVGFRAFENQLINISAETNFNSSFAAQSCVSTTQALYNCLVLQRLRLSDQS